VAGLISASVAVLPQESRAVSFTPVPSSFTGIQGVVDNAATPGGLLNQNNGTPTIGTNFTVIAQQAGSGLGGFAGYFVTDYLALGAVGTSTIGAGPTSTTNQITSSAASATFNLLASDFATGIDITFNYAFAGFSANSAVPQFTVTLNSASQGAISFALLPSRALLTPSSGLSPGTFNRAPSGIITSSISSIDFTNNVFTPDSNDFSLVFGLTEPTGSPGTNAAAGFNQFAVTNSVPFDFDPSAGIAILGAAYGLNKLRKNLKAKKDTIV
jgi:hypothetical protein